MTNLTAIVREVLVYCVIILGACAFISIVGLLVAVDVQIINWILGL